ncbi:chromosome segregation protein SMC [bacterium]|nr:MAG: chromosome segregation protein SMC [bacterium]
MRIRRIELLGFKSFPRRTVIEFHPGITAIVGPNGSGKSNIVDAIKWALGEQSLKELRGERMEDMIFSGGKDNKKKMGMAEVKILFENNGLIPIDYREIMITRRFYRSGEGEYFLNNMPVRLKDIQSLFANTGIHASIISQEMVKEFLLLSPEKVKSLIESVANISRYKREREDALRKLEQVQMKLEELKPRIAEIERKTRSLKIQAGRAQKARELRQRIREITLYLAGKRKREIEEELERIGEELRKKEEEIERWEGKREEMEKERDEISRTLGEIREELNGIEKNIDELERELRELVEQRGKEEAALEYLLKELERLEWVREMKKEDIEKELKELAERKGEMAVEMGRLEGEIRKLRDSLEEVQRKEREKEREEARLTAKKEEKEAYLDNLKEPEEPQVDLEELRRKMEDISCEIEEKEKEKKKLVEEREKEREKRRIILKRMEEIRGRIREMEVRYRMLAEKTQGEGRLGDMVDVKPGHEHIIGSVLSDVEEARVVKREEIPELIERAKKEGKWEVFIFETEKEEKPSLLSFVADGPWKILGRLLSDACVVENLEEALKRSSEEDGKFVTPDGVVAEKGVVKGGKREGLIEKRRKLKDLEEGIKKEKETLRELEEENENTGKRMDEIEKKMGEIDDELRKLSSELSRTEWEISDAEYELQRYREEIEKFRKGMEEGRREVEEMERRLEGIRKEKVEITRRKDEIEKEIDTLGKNMKKLKEILEEIALNIREKERIIEAIDRRRRMEGEIEEKRKEVGGIKERIEMLESEREGWRKKREVLRKRMEEQEKKRNELEEKLKELDRNIREIEREMTEGKVAHARLSTELEDLRREIRERFGEEIGEREYAPGTEEELEELKRKLDRFGQVNELADQEYEEEKARLEHFKEQERDLVLSREELLETINEIDERARKEFMETFEAVRKNFRWTFSKLIEKGEADLVLDGDDPLTAEVKIIAYPYGKKTKQVQLSTGEKTLISLSLLFGVMMLKEAGVFILDEADAPLDETNIDRFLRLLDEFTPHSQVILVTHNRRTMEKADYVYGVTMEEPGISKIVAIRKEEI